MAIILALEKLFDDVEARFALDGMLRPTGPLAPSTFGWRQPSRQEIPGPRIIWVPGDDGHGAVGRLAPPKYPGREPNRPLATLWEDFTVYIHGQDPTAPENERAQWKATRLLFDAWIRAVYLAAYGTFEITSTEWVIDKNQRRFGTAIRVLGAIQAMIPDETMTLVGGAPEELGADIPVTELDHTENVAFPPDPYV
jgi:hypothetical protein